MGKVRDLSVLIASRNEEFLVRTVNDVLDKRRANTEVIVILDGAWSDPELEENPDVTVIYHRESVGQRGGINEAAKLSKAKYIMKLDAHCIMDEGFDVKLMADMKPDWTVIPMQYNLHAFNWKCKKCGNEWYQGPTPTFCHNPGEGKGQNKECDGKVFERVMVWEKRKRRHTEFWRFDKNLQFKYWGGLGKRPESQTEVAETMSFIGACWFMERERFLDLGGLDEDHGSWGQVGTEMSCKAWLSGGKLMVNKKTWYAHLFRTQGGDFSFPYNISGKQTQSARTYSQKFWRGGKWPKQVKPLHWLVEKFWPVDGWDAKDLEAIGGSVDGQKQANTEKGIIFYTDNQLNLRIAHAVQDQLKRIGLPIVSSSLKPMTFGHNVCLAPLKRGYLTMFKQILASLEALKTDYAFFCEHDVMYHPSHFDFKPERDDVWYYNVNMWKVDVGSGKSIRTDNCKQVSGICVNRSFAIKHYQKRVKMMEEYLAKNGEEGFNKYVRSVGFEPGTHNRAERVDDSKSEIYESAYPNLDIRHNANLTPTRWDPKQFRNKKFTEGWKECHVYDIPRWERKQLGFLKLSQ